MGTTRRRERGMPARSSAWSASTSTPKTIPVADAVATVDEDRLAVGRRREAIRVVVRLVREEDVDDEPSVFDQQDGRK